ncbi:MAG: hypothetical protein P4M09_26970 [Devosia sp.]|nr:hypothetical protein [Devosia sp.]
MATLLDDLLVPTKLVLLGIFVGAVSGLALAQISPGPTLAAVAEDPPFKIGSSLSTDLLKLDGRYYGVETAPGISFEPQSTSVVRKIGYGETRFVSVATTSSGTYSTDGLASPYVRYPGMFVEKLHLHFFPLADGVYGWSRLTGWTKIPLIAGNSFGFLDTRPVPASQSGVCVKDAETGACR